MDGRANVAGHGHADGAEGQAQRAVGYRYARLLQLVRVLGLLIEARQEVGVLARRAASDCGPLTLTLRQPRMQIVLSPTSSQQMPLAIDWRKVSLTRRKMTEKSGAGVHDAAPA